MGKVNRQSLEKVRGRVCSEGDDARAHSPAHIGQLTKTILRKFIEDHLPRQFDPHILNFGSSISKESIPKILLDVLWNGFNNVHLRSPCFNWDFEVRKQKPYECLYRTFGYSMFSKPRFSSILYFQSFQNLPIRNTLLIFSSLLPPHPLASSVVVVVGGGGLPLQMLRSV